MKVFLKFIFVFLLLFTNTINVCSTNKKEKKEKAHYIRPMKPGTYEFIVTLVSSKGVCDVPVSQRTKEQKSALVKFWRKRKANKQFTLGKLIKYHIILSFFFEFLVRTFFNVEMLKKVTKRILGRFEAGLTSPLDPLFF